ncbi:uncharacterized protein [Typha latifolia]|uniref:uncharacterized protein isoform X3 n=1 Tax=Typha latifolia TaxID=4733 RepID=UPI003C2C9FC1
MKLVKPIELFQKFLNSGSMKQGRLLGLDVGHKYVGLAVSDTCNKIASPLSVLVRKKTNIDLMAKDFRTLAAQVRLFVEDLQKTGKLDDLSYTYWDENYTSKCVEALLHPLNLHPVQTKTIMDKFAAVGILQGYLDLMHRWNSNPGDISEG